MHLPPFDPARDSWDTVWADDEPEHVRAEQRRRWLERCRAALDQLDDPISRVVCSVAVAKGDGAADTDWEIVGALLPELSVDVAPHLPEAYAPWDHEAVQRWFLEHVVQPPETISVRERILFWNVAVGYPGWWLEVGSTFASRGNTPRQASVAVLADGRRVHGFWRRESADLEVGREEGFNALALRAMARLVDVPALPDR
jgi:hypothetical protein